MVDKKQKQLLEALRTNTWLQPQTKLVVACSGGADSMALTEALWQLREERQLQLFVLHVQHHLRAEAEEEAQQVIQYCAERQLPCRRVDVEVLELVRTKKLSVEEAARSLRYQALEAYRQELGADYICLAHHLLDQAETVLLNLVRGAGSKGLRGMQERNGYLLRPLLLLPKQLLVDYCTLRQVPYSIDASNSDVHYRRNWLRQEIIPQLEQRNPQVVQALARSAQLAGEDEAYLGQLAQEFVQENLQQQEGSYSLSIAQLSTLPPALLGRALQLLLQQAQAKELSFVHLQALKELLASGQSGKTLDLPGLQATVAYGLLTVQQAQAVQPPSKWRAELPLGGQVELPDGTKVHCELVEQAQLTRQPQVCYASYQDGQAPLVLRHREPGDYFRATAQGGKKLKSYLIDQKIPRQQRAALYVVAQGHSILWILQQGKAYCDLAEGHGPWLKLTIKTKEG